MTKDKTSKEEIDIFIEKFTKTLENILESNEEFVFKDDRARKDYIEDFIINYAYELKNTVGRDGLNNVEISCILPQRLFCAVRFLDGKNYKLNVSNEIGHGFKALFESITSTFEFVDNTEFQCSYYGHLFCVIVFAPLL